MKLIIIIVLFSVNTFCQEIGVAVDCVGKVTDKRAYLPIPLSGFDLFFAMKISSFKIEAVVGGQIADETYQGFEYSLYLFYNFLPPLYLIAGVNDHSNNGASSNEREVRAKGFVMPGLGAGVDVSKLFSIEFIYHSLFRREELYYDWDISHSNKIRKYLTGVIKVNFKFRWEL